MKLFITEDAVCESPNLPGSSAPPSRVSACDVAVGMRLVVGDRARVVVARERAIDRTIDFTLAGGERFNAHPFRRVGVI